MDTGLKNRTLSQERLKELLSYEPETGVFIRNTSIGRVKAGDMAGTRHSAGYVAICIDGQIYLAHRLAWLYVHGYMPDLIGHDDQNPTNNKMENLKNISHLENMRNQRRPKHNTSGHVGVGFDKRKNKWISQIMVLGKTLKLGTFSPDFEGKMMAIAARKNAEEKHGYHPMHGAFLV